MDLSVAFFVLAFLAVVAGTSLVYVPAGLIVAGLLLAVTGVLLLPRPERPKGESR